MKQNLEIEYKSMLSETHFRHLNATGVFSAPQIQVNHYYDTPEQTLFHLGMMCRVRVINDSYEFTLKIPQADGVMEHEVLLDSLSLTEEPQINTLLAAYKVNPATLVINASSTTHRQTWDDRYGTWCLDQTTFKTTHDFELEYELHEANDDAHDHFLAYLEAHAIPFQKAQPKYLRALHSQDLTV